MKFLHHRVLGKIRVFGDGKGDGIELHSRPLSEFRCDYCEKRGNLVSGPHNHVCGLCGGKATYGWYTQPRCEACHDR